MAVLSVFAHLLSSLSAKRQALETWLSLDLVRFITSILAFPPLVVNDNNLLSTSNERQGLNLSYPEPDDRLEGLSPRTGGELQRPRYRTIWYVKYLLISAFFTTHPPTS